MFRIRTRLEYNCHDGERKGDGDDREDETDEVSQGDERADDGVSHVQYPIEQAMNAAANQVPKKTRRSFSTTKWVILAMVVLPREGC